MLPNFLIAGGLATGTSFLSASLKHHPEIYLPRIQRPEPNFFHYSWKFEKGLCWYQDTWFNEVSQEKAIGERSSLLLHSPIAPERINELLPEVKLVFCLRNPIERAWGNYRFSVLEGLENLGFDDAIDAESQRILETSGKWAEVQPYGYVTRSHYASQLKNYFDLFGRERILLIKSESLSEFPEDNLRKICEFLGVNPLHPLPVSPPYSSPSVVDPMIQSKLRTYFGDRFPEVIEAIRKEENLSSFVQSSEDQRMVEELRSNLRGHKEVLGSRTRKRLRSMLSDEIDEIAKLVDFSVEDWE